MWGLVQGAKSPSSVLSSRHSKLEPTSVEENSKVGEVSESASKGAAWIVVSGAVVSKVTVLSVLVEASLPWPRGSVAAPAGTEAITVPSEVIPETSTL